MDYLPSPLDICPKEGIDPDHAETKLERKPADNEPFSGLAFKIMADSFVGQLVFVRVYSGHLKTGDGVLNTSKGKSERIGRLLKMHANKREEISEISPAIFAPRVGLKNVTTGDTICDQKNPDRARDILCLLCRSFRLRLSRRRKRSGKNGHGSGPLGAGRSYIQGSTDPDSGQTIISGMGELHLEIIVDRMMREYKVEANVGKPQVAYRETIRKKSEAEGKYIRQTGGRVTMATLSCVSIRNEMGKGYEFVNEIKSGSVPHEFFKPIEQGVKQAMEGGILAGYEMVDIKVTLYDGSYHEVDSDEMAFKIAASMGFKEAARKASPVLLEPIMSVEVVVPEDYHGRNYRRPKLTPWTD